MKRYYLTCIKDGFYKKGSISRSLEMTKREMRDKNARLKKDGSFWRWKEANRND